MYMCLVRNIYKINIRFLLLEPHLKDEHYYSFLGWGVGGVGIIKQCFLIFSLHLSYSFQTSSWSQVSFDVLSPGSRTLIFRLIGQKINQGL